MLWKNCIRAAAAARKTRGKKKKKYRRNAFVSKLNTHVCVAVCVRVEKKAKSKRKQKLLVLCVDFLFLFCFCFCLCSTAAPLLIIISSPFPPPRRKGHSERQGERRKECSAGQKKKESVKAKVFIMRQWLGEAYKRPAQHQSQRIAAHTSRISTCAHTHTQRKWNHFKCWCKFRYIVRRLFKIFIFYTCLKIIR